MIWIILILGFSTFLQLSPLEWINFVNKNRNIENLEKRKEIEEKTNEIIKEFIEEYFYYFSMHEHNNYGNFRILSDSSFKEKPFYKDVSATW